MPLLQRQYPEITDFYVPPEGRTMQMTPEATARMEQVWQGSGL